MGDPSHSLDRSLVQGIAWTGGIRWLAQLMSWAAALIVARLITPTDYGLFAMAMVYAGFVQLVNELGLSLAIIQRRELGEEQIAQLGGLAVLAGFAFLALSVGLSGAIASFFGESAVRWIVIALSLTFVMRGAQVVPRSLLARDLEFRRLAWIDAAEALIWSATTLVGAALGLGTWALVTGAVVSGFAVMGTVCLQRPHRLAWPRDFRSVAGAVNLGGYVVVSQLCWYVYNHADLTIVGRMLGKAALGAYTKGSDVANIPVDRVSSMIGRVTPAVFAAAQDDPPALRRYLIGLTEGLAVVTFPVSVGLALVADQFVLTVLGEQWRPAIVPLRLLGLYGGFRAVFNLLPQMLVATGHAKLNMQFNILMALTLPVALYAGAHWGTTGVALGWIIWYPLVTIPTFFRHTLRILGMRGREYLRALWPAASGAAGIVAAVVLLRALVPDAWPSTARLGIEVGGGALAYVAVLLIAHRARMQEATARMLDLTRTRPLPRHATAPSGARARLLLFSWHFPPDAAVGALRWQKLARYAAERGWGLDVITLDSASLATTDPSRLADLPPGVRVYGVPVPRVWVEQAVQLAWRAYGTARGLWRRGAHQGAGVRRDSLARRHVPWWPRAPRDFARAYFAWLEYARTGRWARAAARRALRLVEPGVHHAVISCGPPHMAHEAGRLVARRAGLPFVMDLRDPWSLVQRLPEAIASPVWFSLAARYERRAVAHASLIVANTDPLRNVMRGAHGAAASRVISVPNGYDDEPVPPSQHGKRFVIGYAGSIYLDRDPRALFRAAALFVTARGLTPEDFGIEFMGHVRTFDGVPIERIAREEGVGAFVRTYPPRPRTEALEFLSRAAMLVILPQDSDMAIPAKVFDYMQFNAWLLALANDGSATEQLLRGSGADVVAPDAVRTIAGLLELRYLQHLRGEWPGRIADDPRYSRRAQADRLFAAIEAIAGAPPHPAEEPVLVCAAS
ncbi:MAG TPA: oligosaccharide flippase family protein [Gemmatimonadales bacterium]|nr:oligosaccharide flippase family protein [Gemmatimonadales bacterium]